MSSFSFNSNISSLKAQRRLGEGSAALQKSFERLSSGMRINRASDDAAGLAISSSLSAYSRIYTQGVRNANDGISLLNVAEGAATEMSSILARLKELASGAANGTLSLTQRRSLDKEAFELQKEFNRITQTTSFNNRDLFDGTFGRLNIQGGTGTSGTIGFNLGSSLSTNVSTGAYSNTVYTDFGANSFPGWFDTGDFNGDGKLDIASSYSITSGSMILLGNGDGTFKMGQVMGQSSNSNIIAQDINKDGKPDIVNAGSIWIGKGDGTFTMGQNFGDVDYSVELVDTNGDGNEDYVAVNGSHVYTRLGNGNGTFGAVNVITATSALNLHTGDFNGDGNLDIVTADSAAMRFYYGAGNGSFAPGGQISSTASQVRVADFNHDGLLDIFGDDATVRLSNGNGTFSTGPTLSVYWDGEAADLNGDGDIDLLLNDGGSILTYFGNGDGTFKSAISSNTGSPGQSAFGDFNGDGVVDHAVGNQFGGGIWANLSAVTSITSMARLDLLSSSNARSALTEIDQVAQRVSAELSAIGVYQSRLQAMTNVLQQSAQNFTAAGSRIVDADIAQESSLLLTRQIHQQAASAVLAQANQIPALALSLLQF